MKWTSHLPPLIMVLIVVFSSTRVYAATDEELRGSLGAVFASVLKAEKAGGDVGSLVSRLNEAALLIDSGTDESLSRAQGIITEVSGLVPSVAAQGSQSTMLQMVMAWITLVVLGTSAVLVWLYGGRVFWRVWLRAKGGWRAELA
ncbi:MAG: hypothetical protein NTY03_05360 [Candidatus Bathyarchaeota archaeon]|nr:hypothetical protein [Candidatus Bathyarchaeota archaeon]